LAWHSSTHSWLGFILLFLGLAFFVHFLGLAFFYSLLAWHSSTLSFAYSWTVIILLFWIVILLLFLGLDSPTLSWNVILDSLDCHSGDDDE
jgi:hypothetical protein